LTSGIDFRQIPILINCRDRASSLAALVGWLERAGHERIYLVDNDSSYPPLLDLYETTPHTVVRLGQNLGHKAPWLAGVVERVAGDGPYIVSDPDVIPDEGCPPDAVALFHETLQWFPEYIKAGFGLRIDDLPAGYRFRDRVRWWEARFWSNPIAPGIYDAGIDTTFALYRPFTPFRLVPAIRTGPPYVARHLAWYVDSADPSEEERYYRARARADASFWEKSALADALEHEARVRVALDELLAVVPEGEGLVLVDQDQWGTGATLRGRRLWPFLERDGQYWGPPADDGTAIDELERLRRGGAHYVVVGWPAFWWLDHYAGFHRHLRSELRPLRETAQLVAFGPPERLA
jgi:hypothetical protein